MIAGFSSSHDDPFNEFVLWSWVPGYIALLTIGLGANPNSFMKSYNSSLFGARPIDKELVFENIQ